MNYIKQLEEDKRELKEKVEELEAKIHEIVVYLDLPKFSQDTNVSKYDILRMLGKY